MRLIDCFTEMMAFTIHSIETMPEEQPRFEDMLERYGQLIGKARERSLEAGSPPHEWDAAFFAVCAWVDEAILTSSWSEKERWQRTPLQLSYFTTINAGEEFFSRLDSLEKEAVEVREVYDYCLSMGFRGSLFRPDDAGRLETIKEEQRIAGNQDQPLDLLDEAFLFPEAYGEKGKGRRKPFTFGSRYLVVLGLFIPALLFFILFFVYRNALDSIVAGYVG